ncbi:MAG: DUF4249 family protein [Bacteroidales bacterium]|nr:DUF4249 family protein [Bacteroidales bacterium]
MKRYLFILMIMMYGVYGCNERISLPQSGQQIVVEGWIENDRFPIVMLTTTVPVTETVTDISDLGKFVINWGKVTIDDGEKEVVLIGQKNDDYFPPYIYTTTEMRGKAGNTYRIKVEYSGKTVTASTTIPQPKQLEYIKVMRTDKNDNTFMLKGGLIDDPTTKDYYKVFTKTSGKDSTYVSSFLGLTDDSILDKDIHEIAINNGTGRIDEKMIPNFSDKDIISVRFCTLDKESWTYWNDFEEIQSLSSNPLFPISTSIRSNIKGGLGYWAGYGSTYYKVSVPDSLTMGKIYDNI